MNLIIHQTINIGQLRVNTVSNSSVLQIGSAGSIQALSQLYNTGGYTEPAPQLGGEVGAESSALSLVPLPSPNPT
jgi:spore germination protein PB